MTKKKKKKKKNSRWDIDASHSRTQALILRILSIVINSDWLQHARCIRIVYWIQLTGFHSWDWNRVIRKLQYAPAIGLSSYEWILIVWFISELYTSVAIGCLKYISKSGPFRTLKCDYFLCRNISTQSLGANRKQDVFVGYTFSHVQFWHMTQICGMVAGEL